MDLKVKAQIGENNTSGNGNNVTQNGNNNQNNSHNQNTINNYYNSNTENNELALPFLGIAFSFVAVFFLFKYYEQIEPIVKYIHCILLGSIYPVIMRIKGKIIKSKDYIAFILTLIIAGISYYSFIQLEKISDFSELSKQAKSAEDIIKFWLSIYKGNLFSSAIFLALGEFLSIIILTMNIYLMVKSICDLHKGRQYEIRWLIVIISISIFLIWYLNHPYEIINFLKPLTFL